MKDDVNKNLLEMILRYYESAKDLFGENFCNGRDKVSDEMKDTALDFTEALLHFMKTNNYKIDNKTKYIYFADTMDLVDLLDWQKIEKRFNLHINGTRDLYLWLNKEE